MIFWDHITLIRISSNNFLMKQIILTKPLVQIVLQVPFDEVTTPCQSRKRWHPMFFCNIWFPLPLWFLQCHMTMFVLHVYRIWRLTTLPLLQSGEVYSPLSLGVVGTSTHCSRSCICIPCHCSRCHGLQGLWRSLHAQQLLHLLQSVMSCINQESMTLL